MTYYITSYSSKRKSYHADKNCHQLHQADNVREATEQHIEKLTPCKRCIKDTREPTNGAEWASFTHRLRAHPEQFK